MAPGSTNRLTDPMGSIMAGCRAVFLPAVVLSVAFVSGVAVPAWAEERAPVTDEYLRGYIASWLELSRGIQSQAVSVRVEEGVVTLRFDPDEVPLTSAETQAIAAFDGVVRVDLERVEAPRERKKTAHIRSWKTWLRPAPGRKTVRFPVGDLFSPPLADTRQPRFHATYQGYRTEFGSINMGSIGAGEDFGLIRAPRQRDGDGWQLGFSGAIMALFNLDGPSTDLINADYYFGVPFSWRQGNLSARARIYHLSSHVGDEFLLDAPVPDFQRINLSYEALEMLASYDFESGVRLYGGVNQILNTATPLQKTRGQIGIEYQGTPTEWRNARFVAGVDLQSWDETDGDIDVSIKTGLLFRSPYADRRKVSLLLEFFNGRTPHGQFYVYRSEYFGLGLGFVL